MTASIDFTIEFTCPSTDDNKPPMKLRLRVTDNLPPAGQEEFFLPHRYTRYMSMITDLLEDCPLKDDKQVIPVKFSTPGMIKAVMRYISLLKSDRYEFVRSNFFRMHVGFFGTPETTEEFYKKYPIDHVEREMFRLRYRELIGHYIRSHHWNLENAVQLPISDPEVLSELDVDTLDAFQSFNLDTYESVISYSPGRGARDLAVLDSDTFSDLNDPLMYAAVSFLGDEKMGTMIDHILDSTGWDDKLMSFLIEHYQYIVDTYVSKQYLLMCFGCTKQFAFGEAVLSRQSPEEYYFERNKYITVSKKINKGHKKCLYDFLLICPMIAKYIMENYDRQSTIDTILLSNRLRKRFMTLTYDELLDSLDADAYIPTRSFFRQKIVSEKTPGNIRISLSGLPYSSDQDLNVAETYDALEAQRIQAARERQRQEDLRKKHGGLGKRARRRGEVSGNPTVVSGPIKKKGPVML